MRPEEQQQVQQQPQWQWHPEGMPGGIPPNYTPRPLPTGAAAAQPPRRPGGRGRWVAAGAAALGVVGVVGWLVAGNNTGDVPSNAKSSVASAPSSVSIPAAHVYSGAELVAMWDNQPGICDNPVTTTGKPDDPHHLLDGAWDDGSYIIAELRKITSPADEKFVRDRYRFLTVVLLQVQGDLTNIVNQANYDLYSMQPGSPAAEKRLAQAVTRINILRGQFNDAVANTMQELDTGHLIENPITELFPESGTCP